MSKNVKTFLTTKALHYIILILGWCMILQNGIQPNVQFTFICISLEDLYLNVIWFGTVNIYCYYYVGVGGTRSMFFFPISLCITMYYFRGSFHLIIQHYRTNGTTHTIGETLLLIRNFWFSKFCCWLLFGKYLRLGGKLNW